MCCYSNIKLYMQDLQSFRFLIHNFRIKNKKNIFEKLNTVPEKKSVITKRRKLSLLVLWLRFTQVIITVVMKD